VTKNGKEGKRSTPVKQNGMIARKPPTTLKKWTSKRKEVSWTLLRAGNSGRESGTQGEQKTTQKGPKAALAPGHSKMKRKRGVDTNR